MDTELKRSDEDILDLFRKLETRTDVANILEIDIKTLIYIVYRMRESKKYILFSIKKKDGTDRIIKAPIDSLKTIQSKLNKILQLLYGTKGKDSAHGFIKDRSIITNAKPHIRRKYVFNIDLEDFFPSINFGRVRGMFFKTFQIGLEAATTLAQISCHENTLPQGSPCSPIISNLICRRLDTKLFYLSQTYGCKYTRYADDITFSSNKAKISNDIGYKNSDGVSHAGVHVKKIIEDNGFKINDSKTNLANQFEHQEVTGLVVNTKVNVRYSYIKNVRSMLYKSLNDDIYGTAIEYIEKYTSKVPAFVFEAMNDQKKKGIIENWFLEVIKGKLQFLKMVRGNEDLIFLKYATIFNQIINDEFFDTEKYNNFENWMKRRIVIIEDIDSNQGNGTGFYLQGYGLITCHHVIEDIGEMFNVTNPFTDEKTILMLNNIKSEKDLDAAICKFSKMKCCFQIESNPEYGIGQTVKVAGYPQYIKGNTLDIRECKIASTSYHFGQKMYIVDGDIFHGASGGPVLNNQNRVIGIIRSGIESLDDDDAKSNMKRGFIPIDVIDKLK